MLSMLIYRKYIENGEFRECQMGGVFRQLLSLVCACPGLQGSVYSPPDCTLYITQEPKYLLTPERDILDL